MENTTQSQAVETPRRGRPERMSKERVQELIDLGVKQDRTAKALCAERHIPYITFVVARKRHGLQTKQLKAVEQAAA